MVSKLSSVRPPLKAIDTKRGVLSVNRASDDQDNSALSPSSPHSIDTTVGHRAKPPTHALQQQIECLGQIVATGLFSCASNIARTTSTNASLAPRSGATSVLP